MAVFWLMTSFNLAIEILFFSTVLPKSIEKDFAYVSISQSRYFSFQPYDEDLGYNVLPEFQSRNRDTFLFNGYLLEL